MIFFRFSSRIENPLLPGFFHARAGTDSNILNLVLIGFDELSERPVISSFDIRREAAGW